jgi:hypothetical protein
MPRRFILPLLAMIAASGTSAAQAADWRVADIAATGFTFIDMQAVKHKGEQVTFSTWTVKTSQSERGIDNWKVVSVADCARHSYRDVRIDYFAGEGFVERSDDEPVRTAAPDTIAFSRIAVACGEKEPASAEAVADPYALVKERGRRNAEPADLDSTT